MPPSPSAGPLPLSGVSTSAAVSGLALPVIGGAPPSPETIKAESSIRSSLANLQSLPPSPSAASSPSLQRLPGFSGVPTGSPITLPSIPSLEALGNEEVLTERGVAPSPIPDISAHDYQHMIGEDNQVEKTLSKSGYLPLGKVITKDENNLLMCKFIKAMDESGRTVFVDMDCEGLVSVDPSNMTMTKISGASVVPHSTKIGAYDSAGSDVSGVAFECEGEVCTLQRTDDLTPKETVFAEINGNRGSDDMFPIAYPIVSLTDIKANPSQVACSVKASHDRMRNVAFGQCRKDTMETIKAAEWLNREVERFNTKRKIIKLKLAETITEFEAMNTGLKRQPPSDKRARLDRSVKFNLRKRNDMVIDHLKLCESINSRVNRIRELAEEIKSLNDYADQLFTGLDTVYNE